MAQSTKSYCLVYALAKWGGRKVKQNLVVYGTRNADQCPGWTFFIFLRVSSLCRKSKEWVSNKRY